MPKQPANSHQAAARTSTATIRRTSKGIGLLLGVLKVFCPVWAGNGRAARGRDAPEELASIRKFGDFTSGIVLLDGLLCHASVNDAGPGPSSRRLPEIEFQGLLAPFGCRQEIELGFGRPTSWIASGRPSRDQPDGMETVGKPV